MTLAAIAADYRALLAKCDSQFPDHSPGAIFRRALRASLANADRSRRWKARAIGLNPEPLANAIALSGMAPIQFDDRWMIGIALPQPNPVGGQFDPVEDVVLIDPKTSTATIMGDRGATIVAPRLAQDRVACLDDAKAWARAIATDRLEWYRLRRDRLNTLKAEPTWQGDVPSALLLAPPSKVRWAEIQATVIDVPANLQRAVSRAVYAQARLPKIEGRA